MRSIINSLTTKNSTKAERRFLELLKSLHIPFQAKVLVNGREVDFIINKHAIDIDGHAQDVEKNRMLIESGYYPIHFNNNDIGDQLTEWLKTLWQEHH